MALGPTRACVGGQNGPMQSRPPAPGRDLPAQWRGRDQLGRALALVAIALCAWLPSTFGAGFAFDDREAIEHNPVVEGSLPWTAAFRQDYWEHRGAAGHFRPLATLTLRLDRALWDDGAGFHATNVWLHGLVVFAAALFLGRITARANHWPWIGLAVFAAHPILADSVAWISGRSSMLSALFGLLAAAALTREPDAQGRKVFATAASFAIGVLGTGLSMLGKEDGLIWAVALPWIAARHGRRAFCATALGAACGVAVALLLREQALGSPWIRAPHAPLAGAELWDRLQVGGRALVEAARLVAWPAQYPPSYAGDPQLTLTAVRESPALGLLGLAAFFIASAIALTALMRKRSLLSASAALALAAWIPFLQLVPSGEIFAPRFLYLPLLFAVPLIDATLSRAFGSRKFAIAAVLIGVCSAGAWSRARVYSSRGDYRRAVLEQHPNDVGSWNDLGIAFEEQQRRDDARAAFERALEIDAHYSRAWSNLGRQALEDGNADEARELLERAVAEGPKNPVAHVQLGRALLALGDPSRAEASFRESTRLAPGLARGWEGLSRALIALDRTDEARSALTRTLALEPKNPRARAMLEQLGL